MGPKQKDEAVDGAKIAAEILKRMPSSDQERLLSAIQQQSPEIAEKIETVVYNFNELQKISTPVLQEALRIIDHQDLVTAMSDVDRRTSAFLINQMSEGKKEMIRSELEHVGRLSPTQIRIAQKKVLLQARELEFRIKNPTSAKRHFLA